MYAFWYSVLNETEALCHLIDGTPVNMDEWHRQKEIQSDRDVPLLELGFSTFFLNRTNRSGILTGGVIGGKNQTGKWKVDARYNKSDLIKRIRKVARYKKRINLYNLDASDFINDVIPLFSAKTLTYLDPPYFIKGQEALYTNFYDPSDHQSVADSIREIQYPWVVSYDDVPEVRQIYDGLNYLDYGIRYSAQARYRGSEIMFFCDQLRIPEVNDPTKVKAQAFQRYLF